MDNKIIVLIIIVLLVIVGAAYVLGTQNSTPSINLNITNTTNNVTKDPSKIIHSAAKQQNNTKKNETANVSITADQAQQIAISSSEDLGFPAKPHGTPTLFKWTQNKLHTWAWDVPLEFESGDTKYGSLYVDADTGNIIMNE